MSSYFRNLFIFLLCFLSGTEILHAANRVCVVVTEENKVYETIIESFQEELSRLNPNAKIKVVRMKDGEVNNKVILDFYPDVNFALGQGAAKICDTFSIFPYLFTMVLNPEAAGFIKPDGKARGFCTGILVILDPEAQFASLKKEIPSTRSIGALYSDRTAEIMTRARKAAESSGMSFYSVRTENLDSVSKSFRELVKEEIDTFWLVLDTNVLSQDTMEYFIEGCKIRKINLLSFNPNHLKMGATIAVFVKYTGLGKQAAEIISRILKGESADKIPVAEAKYTDVMINEKALYSGRK